jgi:hypothetical protein
MTKKTFSLSKGIAGVHWRDPDLHEVIEFLGNPNCVVKANAAAYLQHLCYMDDPVKAKTRYSFEKNQVLSFFTFDNKQQHNMYYLNVI